MDKKLTQMTKNGPKMYIMDQKMDKSRLKMDQKRTKKGPYIYQKVTKNGPT